MKRAMRWFGVALLVAAMCFAVGCNKCDLKTEDLVGSWNYVVTFGTCTGGAGCTGFPAGEVVSAGTMVIDGNGALIADGEDTGIVISGECNGDIEGTWTGEVATVSGTGKDDLVSVTLTLTDGTITYTMLLTMTR